jgi:hypothetical protein
VHMFRRKELSDLMGTIIRNLIHLFRLNKVITNN